MTYSERAYFDGDHCAHVAAWVEALRHRRIWEQARHVICRGRHR